MSNDLWSKYLKSKGVRSNNKLFKSSPSNNNDKF